MQPKEQTAVEQLDALAAAAGLTREQATRDWAFGLQNALVITAAKAELAAAAEHRRMLELPAPLQLPTLPS